MASLSPVEMAGIEDAISRIWYRLHEDATCYQGAVISFLHGVYSTYPNACVASDVLLLLNIAEYQGEVYWGEQS